VTPTLSLAVAASVIEPLLPASEALTVGGVVSAVAVTVRLIVAVWVSDPDVLATGMLYGPASGD